MFIAKTEFDKRALVALQGQLHGGARTHENSLVALSYVFDKESKAHDILPQTTDFDAYIRYVFFWACEYRQLMSYQHPGVDIVLRQMRDFDDTPIWGCFFDATLPTWCEYCRPDTQHPSKFVKVIRDKLVEDGYTLRLRRTDARTSQN